MRPRQILNYAAIASTVFWASARAFGQGSFVNWENPHVHPLDRTPDGAKLLAVNTADNRLEVFDISSGSPQPLGAVPVGLDPVSVRARTNTEVWVVNHISDSISIVDLAQWNVVATIGTLDEPTDVVFAGSPQRAFVSCSQANAVLVFDPGDLAAAPIELAIDAEDPRAMAVSPDGGTVYVAVFESGNESTILGGGATLSGGYPPNVVNDPSGPYGGVNPPPNNGANFNPPQNLANPAPPKVGLIVKKDPSGQWMDDNNGNWTDLVSGANASLSGRPVGWDLPDYDLVMIDADDLTISYAPGLMNICMAVGVNPATGFVTVVGTDGINEIRYEPILSGQFLRVNLATVDPGSPTSPTVVDLNPHLTYATSTVPQGDRDQSIGDPRAIVWNAAGTLGYVTGMGSNNIVVIDAAGSRAGLAPTIEVGEGPTGLVLDEKAGRLYVLNKFEATISVVDVSSETELESVEMFDPTPASIRTGRKHLYDTHANSGLGQVSCASCHVDARIDRLAWDLGNPAGAMKPFNQNCNAGVTGGCQPWHPMKGPMTTQTLQDIIGKEPHHWRGDRNGLEEFNGAFMGLLGDDAMLTGPQMQEFESFLATITFPPNPFRTMENSLPAILPLPGHFTAAGVPLPPGNAVNGLSLYRTAGLDGGVQCVSCHTLPTGLGTNYRLFGAQFLPQAPGPNGELHLNVVSVDGSTNVSIKVPHLRNLYEKVGFEATQTSNRAGFGFLHDGSVDSIARFLTEPVFSPLTTQQLANLVAFMLAFSGSDLPLGSPSNPQELPGPASKDTHAGVGVQTTLVDASTAPPAQILFINDMVALANADEVGLIVKGRQGGLERGYAFMGSGQFQSDRAAETISSGALLASAAPGSELTYTLVPAGSEIRIGIDRDLDGHYDQDEVDGCSDPADAQSIPPQCPVIGACCGTPSGCADDVLEGDCVTGGGSFQGGGTTCQIYGDINHDTFIDLQDVVCVLDGFQGGTQDCPEEDADIAPCGGNEIVDLFDIFAVLDAFSGIEVCCGN